MNLKRFSCLSLLTITAIIFIVFVTVFFFVLGKVIFGKEPQTHNIQYSTWNKDFVSYLVTPCYVVHQPAVRHGDPCFMLHIPSINLNQEVIENTDPTNKDLYLPIIENNIAHGKYTYTPAETYKQQKGITYLFSHKDAGAKIFKNLENVGINESVYINYAGNIYSYTVISKKYVNPNETSVFSSESPLPLLRLQTCADGTNRRLIVDAKLQGVV